MGNTLEPGGPPGAPQAACGCDQMTGVPYMQQAYRYYNVAGVPVACRETDPSAARQGLPDDGTPTIVANGRPVGPAVCVRLPSNPLGFPDSGYLIYYRYPDPACPQPPGGCQPHGA